MVKKNLIVIKAIFYNFKFEIKDQFLYNKFKFFNLFFRLAFNSKSFNARFCI